MKAEATQLPTGEGKKVVVRDDDLTKPTTLRDIRRAHEPIEDSEFQEIVEQATVVGVSLTRKALADIGKRKRREKVREERDTKLSAQETLFPTGQLYTVWLPHRGVIRLAKRLIGR